MVRAEPRDAFMLAALELQLNHEQGRRGEADFLARYADVWLSEYDRRPAWIARSGDGRPLGAIVLYVVAGLPRPGQASRPWAHVTDLYVVPQVRRGGVGNRLLQAGLDWCRDNMVTWVQLSATASGSGLCRRAGFTPVGARLLRLDLP